MYQKTRHPAFPLPEPAAKTADAPASVMAAFALSSLLFSVASLILRGLL